MTSQSLRMRRSTAHQANLKAAKFPAAASVAARSKLAYWQEMVGKTIFFGMVLLIFTQLWGTLLGQEGSLAGFDRRQLVWYLTITEVIALAGTSLLRTVETDVKSGQIAYLLIRPVNYVLYQAAYFVGEMLVGIVLNLMVGGAIAFLLVGPPPVSLPSALQTLVLMGVAIGLKFCFTIAIALLSFFTEEARSFYFIYSKMIFTLGGLFVPIDIYPRFFRRLAEILPFHGVAYGPARAFIGVSVSDFWGLLLKGIFWIGLLCLLIRWEYRKGVKQVNVNGG